MTQHLQDGLSTYLGELLHKEEAEHNWTERDKITRKINALYVLLDIEKQVETISDKIYKIVKELK